MKTLFETLRKIISLSSVLESKLDKLTILKDVPAGTILAEAGHVCQYLYFIAEGIAIAQKQTLQQEVTFVASDAQFICVPESFINQSPSQENIKAITDCRVIAITYQHLQTLIADHPEINTAYNRLVESFSLHYKAYIKMLREKQADVRLSIFYQTQPKAARILKDEYIASYLNLTRESVVRAKKKLREKERLQKL